uniref:Carboxypeptidase n=1 Tax=Oryzias latipes TaxID=8090 RepID=A0A3P9L8Q2_ORYLA
MKREVVCSSAGGICFSPVTLSAGLCAPPPPKEAWNYVEVRDGAHMFWWLYHADAGFQELPLVMWLQGGPGGSGSGFGNFEEIGPLDRDLQPRSTSWVKAASVLFVDNPVGTGFSFVDRADGFATDVSMVASDMLVLLQNFFTERPEFQSIPFYIFSESYGGKMAAAISLELTKAVAQGSVKCSFAGVALGDSWISPLDSVMTWGPYLYTTSLLDDSGLADVSGAAEAVKQAVEQQRFLKATELWSVAETVVEQNTNGVNFYNILTQESEDKRRFSALRHVSPLQRPSLSQLMNGPIRKKLGIIPQNVTWGGNLDLHLCFSASGGGRGRPAADRRLVRRAWKNRRLLTPTSALTGQEQWVKRLKWDGLPGFSKLRWTPLDDPASQGATGAFYKTYKNFSFYWILKAGHMIPSDQGAMALKMLKMVTQQD